VSAPKVSPQTMRRVHLAMMACWAAQMVALPFVMPLDWRIYVLELSLYANFATNWSGWSAERPTEIA